MWQSLSTGANYKSAYCMAVCPAGEDVLGTYHPNRKKYVEQIVKPLGELDEPIYVIQVLGQNLLSSEIPTRRHVMSTLRIGPLQFLAF